ncbi:MAG TPA: class II aldolase/adducin family protein [Chloroflexota bacterium]|nr:class II aldolase/adducin family protein [Chloroflexota bacterium]
MADLTALKEEVALTCRMCAHERLFDYSGHVSVRHPDGEHVLIHSHGAPRYDVTANDVLVIDLDGNVVEGDDRPPTEMYIHTQVYRARPDVQSVIHAHSRMAVVMSIAGVTIVPVTNNALFLGGDPVPVYPDPRLVRTARQGDELARALGQQPACVMRHHGTTVVGSRIMDAFIGAMVLEENALRQHLAMQVGTPIPFTHDELHDIVGKTLGEPQLRKIWDYFVSRARRAGLA